MLAVRGLEKRYGKRVAVRSVTFDVHPGEIIGLLGPNGAGKSTTFQMVVGLLRPSGGSICLGGKEISRLPVYRRARAGLGYLPQECSLFRRLTVRQNLLAIAELLPLGPTGRKQLVDSLLNELAIGSLSEQRADSLSGGERRRLEIARALVTGPRLLLLDEPFSGVDPISVQEVQRILLRLKERSIGILITDHNVRETLAIVDRAHLLHEGAILAAGDRNSLLADALSRKFYLGDGF
ncbi:MAG: LPS export ABC transporter ATP-binding protein [Puniceicoccales bacterium]|jgi:lipopolysaccharide export system ATP-binding protein|nr:LPS export ABC transporter ATP-binding protein [Puniceicoccales bacterium]